MADKILNSEDFALNDIWHILDLVEDSDYTSDTVGGVTYHNFDVLAGETISFGEDEVFVEAGFHQLVLNAHTAEWIGYYPPVPPKGVQKIEQSLISDGDLSSKDARTIAESLYKAGIRAEPPTTDDEEEDRG